MVNRSLVILFVIAVLAGCTLPATPEVPTRPVNTPTVTPPTPRPTATRRPGIGPFWHLIQRGDTLWDISGHYYGQPQLWRVICEANPRLSDCDLIHAGNWLWIPRLS